ncbi:MULTISPECIES: hypothetical protein [Streptomyces]|uniref:hypothetical protein n=1 Tax=Streptomyces TaxID=1883 RepID=UPI001C273592|nr:MULTISPECIES: hypothetical protein [Streptomyces]GHI94175.1 hypothetical protein TPA0905_36460 [Streptomyces olivaceus]
MSPLASAPTSALSHQTPALSGCLDRPHIAAAFAEDATIRNLAADSIEGVLHEPADRSRVVLGLHNPSATEARINLSTLLPERADCTWHFLSGSVRTSEAADGMYVHLDAAGTAWLTAAP